MHIHKNKLINSIEPFIFSKLEAEIYDIIDVNACSLLTWNRFDLAFKLCYLDYVNVNPVLANHIYKHDIKAQTLGKFVELGHENDKNNIESYIEHFNSTYQNIKANGFLKEKTLIPLSLDGGIINGAHRVASAIHLNENVSTIKTEQSAMVADYQYFFERDVPLEHLDIATQKFIQYSDDNFHIAFLWPSGNRGGEAENHFSNIVYKKKIKLTPQGAFNLLFELYKHMDWVGTKEDGYRGIKQKLIECFPRFVAFQVIFFQSESLKKVQEIKERVRDIYKIGYSSIHITDTKEEAVRISSLLCNENGLHFLNYSVPYKISSLKPSLERFKQFIAQNNINIEDVVVDGGLILTLYGYRENTDIDFLVADNSQILHSNHEFEIHDSELLFHGKSKLELIYDPSNYFIFNGVKFIAYAQLYKMKKVRNEEKDLHDCAVMKAYIHGHFYAKLMADLKQKLFYQKIKYRQSFKPMVFRIFHLTRLYKPIRCIYRLLKGNK